MYWEINTTSGVDIINGLDKHHINFNEIVDVHTSGQKLILSSAAKKVIRIDWADGVYVNGVLQTVFNDFYSFMKSLTATDPYPLSFTNADLVANVLTVNHGRNATLASTKIWNNLGEEIFQYVPTKVTNNQETIDFGGAITGTWNLIVKKES